LDEDLIEKKISSRAVYDGRLLHVKCDEVELPNGERTTREWIKHPGAAAVLPLLDDGRVILVRQYRYPIGQVTLEIPAGKLDVAGEEPLGCAQRELQEETGYTAKEYVKLITLATTVGFSDEVIHIYLARGLAAGKQHLDEDEFINVETIPLSEALRLVQNNVISDGKSVVALLMAKELAG